MRNCRRASPSCNGSWRQSGAGSGVFPDHRRGRHRGRARSRRGSSRWRSVTRRCWPKPHPSGVTTSKRRVLREELRAALESADLERADALLAEILAAQDRELARRALEAAATCATRGEVAMTRLRYREAADHFGAAAGRVPAGQESDPLDYLDRQARARYLQGAEFGDNDAARLAVDALGAFGAVPARARSASLGDDADRGRALCARRARRRDALRWRLRPTRMRCWTYARARAPTGR